MSKTIETQIEKSRILIEGLRNNISTLADKGITTGELDQMSASLDRLREANRECDELRSVLSAKVHDMNSILLSVKEAFAEKKRVIKGYYPQEEWMRYGVQDKR